MKIILKYSTLALIALFTFGNVQLSGALYLDQESILGNSISTGDWTAPYVKIESPADGDVVSGSVEVLGTVTDNDSHHYWLVIQNTGGTTIAGPGTVNEANSFTNQLLHTWDTIGVPDGEYVIKLEARDAAGNKNPDLSPVPVDPEDPNDSVDWITVTVDNEPDVALGDVVINEVMWMGTKGSPGGNDEWMELRNMTDEEVDLTDWTIDGAGPGLPGTITLEGVISANGYFLISRYDSDDVSEIADDIVVDQVVSGLSFVNGGEQLTLRYPDSTIVDQTPTGVWPAGANGSTRKSMERNADPGDGTSITSWHACEDPVCNDGTYWDTDEGDTYGTPGSVNHSDNDQASTNNKNSEDEEHEEAAEDNGSEEEGSNDPVGSGEPESSASSPPPALVVDEETEDTEEVIEESSEDTEIKESIEEHEPAVKEEEEITEDNTTEDEDDTGEEEIMSENTSEDVGGQEGEQSNEEV